MNAPIQLDLGEAVLVDWTAERYHGDPATLSRSMLEDLRKKGPRYFLGRHVARKIPFEETPQLLFGTYAHEALLEPHLWRRTRRGVEASIVQHVERVVAAVRAHPMVQELERADDGANEQTILWREPDHGLVLRTRLDMLRDLGGDTLIIGDLKTSKSAEPEEFAKTVARYGYHRQAAIYSDALQALRPDCEVHFIFIVVSKNYPFEVACYELPADALELGRRQYRRTLAEYAERLQTNDWTAPWERSVNELTLPKWAFYEE